MNNNTRIALAGLLSATGAFINALAAEFGNSPSGGGGTPEPAAPVETPKPKKQKAEKPAEKPADPAPETPAEEPAETTTEGVKTYEELKAMIEPLVKAGQGPDVKKVIAKYAVNLQELATKPQHHKAFENDLAALSY